MPKTVANKYPSFMRYLKSTEEGIAAHQHYKTKILLPTSIYDESQFVEWFVNTYLEECREFKRGTDDLRAAVFLSDQELHFYSHDYQGYGYYFDKPPTIPAVRALFKKVVC